MKLLRLSLLVTALLWADVEGDAYRWIRLPPPGDLELDEQFIALSVDATNGQRLFVLSDRKLYNVEISASKWEVINLPDSLESRVIALQDYSEVVSGCGGRIYLGGFSPPVLSGVPIEGNWVLGRSAHSSVVVTSPWQRSMELTAAVDETCAVYGVSHEYMTRGGPGLAKSTDAGATWEVVDSRPIGKIAVDSSNSARLVRLRPPQVELSSDGGRMWAPYVSLPTGLDQVRDFSWNTTDDSIWMIDSSGALLRIAATDLTVERPDMSRLGGGALRVIVGDSTCRCVWVLGADRSIWSVARSYSGLRRH